MPQGRYKTGDHVQLFRKPKQQGVVKDVLEKPTGNIYLVAWRGGVKIGNQNFPHTWEAESVLAKVEKKA